MVPSMENKVVIKFKNTQLSSIRRTLLKDLQNEHYACLIAKTEVYNDKIFILVRDVRFPGKNEVINSSVASLKVKGSFTENVLNEIENRFDADTLIEVHTHPFTRKGAHFSSVDDNDEKKLTNVIKKHFPNINYGSIVFSQEEYSARMWVVKGHTSAGDFLSATIKTQNINENIVDSENRLIKEDVINNNLDFLNRAELMLGKKNIEKISKGQSISIIGLGGIGSAIAENLIHSGFNNLILVDHDKAELSNLNRLVGLTYDDAVKEKLKVELIKKHLKSINPNAIITTFPQKIEEISNLEMILNSDWIIMATDNHYSRFLIQEMAFKYYIPFINVGVNITVEKEKVLDISGEVIIVKVGDNYCLSCLNRLNSNEIQKVLSKDVNVREGLINKGYVSGLDVKEPAVKTLNSIMAALTVDKLLNEYTGLRKNNPITVYENNEFLRLINDDLSINKRKLNCYTCDV